MPQIPSTNFKILITVLIQLLLVRLSWSQTINLKSGVLSLQDNKIETLSFENSTYLHQDKFYGIVKADKSAQLLTDNISTWLSNEFALVHLPIEDLNLDQHDYYSLPALYKLDPYVNEQISFDENITVLVNIYTIDSTILSSLNELGTTGEYDYLNRSINISIKGDNLQNLTKLPFVYWIEMPPPALETNNLRERTNHRVPLLENFASTYSLTGKGVVMGEWDGGGADDHIDYDHRHTRIDPFVNNNNGRHATHVAGTMLGAGIKDPKTKGMAPEATFYSYDFFGNVPNEMDDATGRYDLEFTQNSYSYGNDPCSRRGTYDNTSVALDRLVNKYPNLLHVFAGGNSRGDNCRNGGYGTVKSGYQASKNSLAVAAVTFQDGNSSFHSYGPMRDGRLKPEISAVGVSVNSTFPGNTYRDGYSGTSMACPGTSGTAALITQLYKTKYPGKPDAHLIKGVLCNAADELGRSGPDYQYGFGRLNGFNAATIIENQTFIVDSVNQNNTVSDTIFIDNPHQFKIMLCYDDVEGTSSASRSLVNNLDITIKDDAGNVFEPWVLNPNSPTAVATRGKDDLNNIEQITINQPTSKYYVYTVTGTSINSGYQRFSVNWLAQDTVLRMVYPNGGEKWVPPVNTATRQTIRWDAYGITGNGTLSYSTDSGTTWNVISSNVNISRGYYNWQNCPSNVATANALIKIEKGTFSDESNAVFDIYVTGPSIAQTTSCSEQIHISWIAMTGARGYHVYMNEDGKMKDLGYTEETEFTIRNLDNNKSYWIALSAVSSNGAEGPRNIAEEFTPDASLSPPRFPANLSGRTVCSGSNSFFISSVTGQNITYTNWQLSTDNGITWNDIPNATSNTLGVMNISTKFHGNLYRYAAKNNCLSVETSDWAYLNVDTVLPFSYDQNSFDLCVGQSAEIEIIQNGNNRNQVDWYRHNGSTSLLQSNGTERYSLSEVGSHQSGDYFGVLKNTCGTQQNNLRVSVNVRDTLELSFIGTDSICAGNFIDNEAVASGGRPENYDYFWKNSTGEQVKGAKLLRPFNSEQNWTAGVFDNCSEDTVYVERNFIFRPLPQVSISADTTICFGSAVTIGVTVEGGDKGYYGYVWKNENTDEVIPVNEPTLEVSPGISTIYSVQFIDSCSQLMDLAQVSISVLEPLQVRIQANKDTLCFNEGQIITAVGSGGLENQYSFEWNDGNTEESRIINLEAETTYSINLIDNCSSVPGQDSITFTVLPPLGITISGKDTLCVGEEMTYTGIASGGLAQSYNFNWSGQSTSEIQVKGNVDTLLTLQLTDGCSPQDATVTKSIVIREPLTLTSDQRNVTTCHGELIELNVVPDGGLVKDYSISWGNQPSTVLARQFKFYKDTLLRVTLTDNCSEQSANHEFNISVREPLTILPNPDIRTCKFSEETFWLVGKGGLRNDYEFFVNEIPVSSNSWTETYTDSVIMIVRLTDNCTESDALDSFWVEVKPINPVIFNVEQENLVVKAKTKTDLSRNYWSTNGIDFIEFSDTSAILTYGTYGPATLCLQKIDDFECRDTNCVTLTLFDVFTTQDFKINVYPNPTDNKIHLSLDKIAGKISIDLIYINGKSVWEEAYTTFDQTYFEFDVSDLAAGIYLLEIQANNETFFEKIIVE